MKAETIGEHRFARVVQELQRRDFSPDGHSIPPPCAASTACIMRSRTSCATVTRRRAARRSRSRMCSTPYVGAAAQACTTIRARAMICQIDPAGVAARSNDPIGARARTCRSPTRRGASSGLLRNPSAHRIEPACVRQRRARASLERGILV